MNKLATKPTLRQRVKVFVDKHFMIIMMAALITSLVVLEILSFRSARQHLKAPVEACKSIYTGQQKTEQWYTYQCAAYNQQGVCTVNMPVYNEYTYQEVNNQCNWNEWR